MKIITIGDPHFKVDNIPEVELFVDKLLELCEAESPDLIVCLGDILHTHERVHVTPLNKAYDFIKKLRDVAPTYVLVGNHDYIQNQQFLTTNHWMNGMKDWEGVTIVDNVITATLSDVVLTFVPYVPPGRFIEALDSGDYDWKSSDIIFAHQEFYGCKMGAILSVEGDKWDDSYPQVISGHVHSKQTIGKNIYYTGSAMQNAFGESEENIIAVVEVYPGDLRPIREVDLGLPRKKIVYTDMEAIDKVKVGENADKLKITVSGNFDEFKAFKKSEKYKELTEAGAKIAFKKSDAEEVVNKTTSSGFKHILEELVTGEKDPWLMEAYEIVVNNKGVKGEDIIFI